MEMNKNMKSTSETSKQQAPKYERDQPVERNLSVEGSPLLPSRRVEQVLPSRPDPAQPTVSLMNPRSVAKKSPPVAPSNRQQRAQIDPIIYQNGKTKEQASSLSQLGTRTTLSKKNTKWQPPAKQIAAPTIDKVARGGAHPRSPGQGPRIFDDSLAAKGGTVNRVTNKNINGSDSPRSLLLLSSPSPIRALRDHGHHRNNNPGSLPKNSPVRVLSKRQRMNNQMMATKGGSPGKSPVRVLSERQRINNQVMTTKGGSPRAQFRPRIIQSDALAVHGKNGGTLEEEKVEEAAAGSLVQRKPRVILCGKARNHFQEEEEQERGGHHEESVVHPGAVAVLPGVSTSPVCSRTILADETPLSRTPSPTTTDAESYFDEEPNNNNINDVGIGRVRNSSNGAVALSATNARQQPHLTIQAHLVDEDEVMAQANRISQLEVRLRDLIMASNNNNQAERGGSSPEQRVTAADDPSRELVVGEVVDPPATTTTRRRKLARRFFIYCLAVLIPVAAVVGIVVWAVTRGHGGSQGIVSPGAQGKSNPKPSGAPTAIGSVTVLPTSAPALEPPCIVGGYYYTYDSDNGNRIGFINVLTTSSNQEVSAPDCRLESLAFDRNGTAYGHCRVDDAARLVTVNLRTGKTTLLATFMEHLFGGMAYNPLNDHLYTVTHVVENNWSLTKIEKDWTLTTIGTPFDGNVAGFAIDSMGNGFSTDVWSPVNFYAVDLEAGTTVQLTGGQQQRIFPSLSIAFHGQTLYGIEASMYSPMLFTVDRTTGTTSDLFDTNAPYAEGGAFCPLSSNPTYSSRPLVSPPPSLTASSSLQPSAASAPSQGPCIPGRYYYAYTQGIDKTIGSVDVTTAEPNQYMSTADCVLTTLAFDRTGNAYGYCFEFNTLVMVDLESGETAVVVDLPGSYHGLVYNPVDDHFYTTQDTRNLVRIEKDWTFTPITGALLHTFFSDLAIDANGNAFACDGSKVYSVNVTTGVSTLLGNNYAGHTLAIKGSTLYGIDWVYPATLFTIHATNGTAIATTPIKNTEAEFAEGGDFCPL